VIRQLCAHGQRHLVRRMNATKVKIHDEQRDGVFEIRQLLAVAGREERWLEAG
jgi:hypothetical protein